MTVPLSSIMSIGTSRAEPEFAVACMDVNVADPKLASEGWAAPTTVGSSSIHSAESPGPL